MALVAFFEKDGKQEVLLLDIIEVPESHTGERLAKSLEECLEAMGIDDKVRQLSLTV